MEIVLMELKEQVRQLQTIAQCLKADQEKIDIQLDKYNSLARARDSILPILEKYSDDRTGFTAAYECYRALKKEIDKVEDCLGRLAEAKDKARYHFNAAVEQVKKAAASSSNEAIREFDYDSLIDRNYISDMFYFDDPLHFAPFDNFESKYRYELRNN